MKIAAHQDFLDWYQPIHAPFVRFCSSKAKSSDGDNWMRAEAAKEYGLIDEVLERP